MPVPGRERLSKSLQGIGRRHRAEREFRLPAHLGIRVAPQVFQQSEAPLRVQQGQRRPQLFRIDRHVFLEETDQEGRGIGCSANREGRQGQPRSIAFVARHEPEKNGFGFPDLEPLDRQKQDQLVLLVVRLVKQRSESRTGLSTIQLGKSVHDPPADLFVTGLQRLDEFRNRAPRAPGGDAVEERVELGGRRPSESRGRQDVHVLRTEPGVATARALLFGGLQVEFGPPMVGRPRETRVNPWEGFHERRRETRPEVEPRKQAFGPGGHLGVLSSRSAFELPANRLAQFQERLLGVGPLLEAVGAEPPDEVRRVLGPPEGPSQRGKGRWIRATSRP